MTNENRRHRYLQQEPDKGSTPAEVAKPQLPLRGLAMILIAVAVLLGLWAVYAFTKDSGSNQAGETAVATATSTSTVAAENTPQLETAEPGVTDPRAPGQAEANKRADARHAEPAGRVNVVNNSTISGLAENTFNQLRSGGEEVGDHGNLPGDVAALGETTIFFQPGDAAGEAKANELAERIRQLNGVPVTVTPNIDGLPSEFRGNGQITLALIGDITV